MSWHSDQRKRVDGPIAESGSSRKRLLAGVNPLSCGNAHKTRTGLYLFCCDVRRHFARGTGPALSLRHGQAPIRAVLAVGVML